MSYGQIDEDAIRERVEKRIKQRRKFYEELSGYITANVICWVIWVLTTPGGFPWPLFVTLGTGIGAIQSVTKFLADRSTEDLVQREIEREKERLYGQMPEKPKRDQAVRLADDGELVYDDRERPATRRRQK